VSVDEPSEQVYIAAVAGKSMGQISGLPTNHPLDQANLLLLWDEVAAYWRGRDMVLMASVFSI
jgi:hypothetical protein